MATGTVASALLQAELEAAGLERVVVDTRNAHPPCVLIAPPERLYDLHDGWTATWRLFCLAPGEGGNADTAAALDDLADRVADALAPDVLDVTPTALTIRAGEPPVPAFVVTVTRAV